MCWYSCTCLGSCKVGTCAGWWMSCIDGLVVECWRLWSFSSKPRVVIKLCGNGSIDHGLFNYGSQWRCCWQPYRPCGNSWEVQFSFAFVASECPTGSSWSVQMYSCKAFSLWWCGRCSFQYSFKGCLSPCFSIVIFILYASYLAQLDVECTRSGAFMFSSIRAKLIGRLGFTDVLCILLALGSLILGLSSLRFCNVLFCG